MKNDEKKTTKTAKETTATKDKKKLLPTVLAFERKISLSDGTLYSTTWDKHDVLGTPLPIVEKATRGTISNRMKTAASGDPSKINKDIEAPNPQRVDGCALPENHDTLQMRFTCKFLSGVENPSSCNHEEFQANYTKAAKEYIKRTGFKKLARRYAINLANARTLWRNRVGAHLIEVKISNMLTGEVYAVVDAKKMPLHDFNEKDTKVLDKLVDDIADALSGKTEYLILDVKISAYLCKGVEVYPSEEMVMSKSKDDKKSKILYSKDGIAALHSQKIGNAIRTIDTWYPSYGTEHGVGPIAAEVYGAVTSLGRAFRDQTTGKDFYTLFDGKVLGGEISEDDADYVMSVLIRGGVFGQSTKEQ